MGDSDDFEHLADITDAFSKCELGITLNGVPLDAERFLNAVSETMDVQTKRQARAMLDDLVGFAGINNMLLNIQEAMDREVRQRFEDAGISIDECRLTHLAYAQEIAQAMLRRQQAEAVIAARQKIVIGAVSMVETALQMLSEKDVVHLDDDAFLFSEEPDFATPWRPDGGQAQRCCACPVAGDRTSRRRESKCPGTVLLTSWSSASWPAPCRPPPHAHGRDHARGHDHDRGRGHGRNGRGQRLRCRGRLDCGAGGR